MAVGRIADHPVEENVSCGLVLSERAHSYNFWRKAGTTCLAVRLRWEDPPLCTLVNATWSISPIRLLRHSGSMTRTHKYVQTLRVM